MGKKRKLFCEYGKIPYKISLFKEAKIKDFKDFKAGKKFAKKKSKEIMSIFGRAIQKYYLENYME